MAGDSISNYVNSIENATDCSRGISTQLKFPMEASGRVHVAMRKKKNEATGRRECVRRLPRALPARKRAATEHLVFGPDN